MHLGSVANCYLQMEGHEQQQQQQQNVTNGLIKIQIANHPLYPDLLSAYIECQKVGAPPEMACLLEDIGRGSHIMNARPQIRERDGLELDHFMESYCEILHRYKEELSKPFNEATLFLGDMESQLSKLCKAKTLTKSSHNYSRTDHEVGGALEGELSCEEKEAAVEGHELSCSIHPGDEIEKLKEMLLRKYRGQFSSLRKEFQKKRKKGKLPKDARVALMNWWNTHHKWPYPTEEEKVKIAEITGLDQKQINNWFINQRKRHWKPTEDMRFAIMEGLSTSIGGPLPFQF